MVKNIPMQHPMNPTMEAIKLTINNPKSTNGCFETIMILDFMACTAFKFPKIINGTVRKLNNQIAMVVNTPTNSICAISSKVDNPDRNMVITNVAIISSLK